MAHHLEQRQIIQLERYDDQIGHVLVNLFRKKSKSWMQNRDDLKTRMIHSDVTVYLQKKPKQSTPSMTKVVNW